MKAFGKAFAFYFVVLCCATAAWADTDQLCLKQCVAEGFASGACMTRCSYGEPLAGTTRTLPTKPLLSPHRVLKSPVPAGDRIVLDRKPTRPGANKDYACFNQCIQGGSSYHLCEARCTKADCPLDVTKCPNPAATKKY